MKVVCAWCNRDMGYKMGPDELVSHGICIPCAEKVRAENEILREDIKNADLREQAILETCARWERIYRRDCMDPGQAIDGAEIMLGTDR